jgi:hypothetical protein
VLLEKYKTEGLLYNAGFLNESPEAGTFAYRGDLVLVPGEVGDDKGHTKPPKEIIREVVLLANDKLQMVLGGLDKISFLPSFIEKYQNDFAPDMKAIFYVVNIDGPAQVKVNDASFVLIPLVQGVPWNETMEELALEKSDFKGQSPAEKVQTMYKEVLGYQAKYPTKSLDDVLTATTNAVREVHGAL